QIMKFGEQLAARIYEPWREFYINYTNLKVNLKQRQLEHGWQTIDENEFADATLNELSKVYTFVSNQLDKLSKRAEQAEASMLIVDSEIHKYDTIADSLTEILFDGNDLAKFYQLNLTGFQKIIKKHDRYTQFYLANTFLEEWLHQFPLDKLSLQFDVLIVKISKLHDMCHLRGNPRSQQQAYAQGGDQTAFERATAKYWIHPDNITEVKSIILFHLPVHVFDQQKKYEASDMAVSSVYFDNKDFDLYSERLERSEGAEAIRLRWYGRLTEESNAIYVERKTHKATWLNGKSVKDRFKLKEPQVNAFLSGQYTSDALAQDLSQKSKNKKNSMMVKETHFIATGVQKSFKERHLKPTCRVFYNRTAFQLPGDQRLRISLDSNLTFIREDGSNKNWKRNDIDINYPFRSVPEEDISRFPYAVLETKLQTHLGQESPAWLTALIDSHLVHEVPRFSKYLHGAAMLFDVPSQPYWLSQFGMDIRKSPIQNVGLSRSMSFKPLVNGHHRQSLLQLYEQEMGSNKLHKNKSLSDLRLPNLSSPFRRRKPQLTVNLLDTQQESQPSSARDLISRFWNHTPISAQLPSSLSFKRSDNKELLPRTRSSLRQGKKMEAKTFFANERTFITWLQFCALLLTVALTLLNNGDHISRIIGAVFIILASLLSLYALARFQFRSWQLRTNRQIIRYDDVWGPT
ncbi:vacuolar transporter chaperone, partial [Rhizopus stolonifer]